MKCAYAPTKSFEPGMVIRYWINLVTMKNMISLRFERCFLIGDLISEGELQA